MTKVLKRLHLIIILITFSCTYFLGQTGNSRDDSLLMKSKSTVDTVRLSALKALTWSNRFSDPIKAFEYAFEGISIADKLKRPNDLATLHNYIGVLAIKISSFDKARVHIMKAYKIADSVKNITEKAYALNNLGEIFYQTENFDSAFAPLQEAADMFQSINNLTGLAYAYNQIGMAYRSQQKYDQAVKYHSLSLDYWQKLEHHYFTTKAYQSIGIDLLEKGDFAGAREYFEKMDPRQMDRVSYFSPPYRLLLIGRTYEGEKNENEAIKYYQDVLNLAQSIPLYTEMRDAAKYLSDINDRQKYHQTALFYFNKFKIYDDSVKSRNLVERYKQLEMKSVFDQQYRFLEYKLEQDIKTQKLKLFWNRIIMFIFVAFVIVLAIFSYIQIKNKKTIAKQNAQLLLQKADIETKNEELYAQNQQISEQNEAIAKQRDELALANATKDKFFSIIAHDLRGPVGNLTAFFDMILESYQEQLDPRLKELFNLIKTSVQQTYTLLENLLTWAQLQNGTIPFNPVSDSIFSLVDNNMNLLQATASEKSISILNEVPENLYGKFDTHLIDSVLRNLITNAIKFTFPNGEVKIKGKKKYNSIEISVEDTGVGMSQEEISRLFKIDVKHKSKEGTEGEKGTGLGLILCKEFIELHKGKIWVESESGKGCQFKFILPAI